MPSVTVAATLVRRAATALATLTGLGAATVLYAATVERRWLHVTTRHLAIAHLPPAWDGMRVAQLSDMHLGSLGAPYATMRHAVARIVALRPDMIALTGDFTERGNRQPLDFLAPLAHVAPTFAVLGNHDYFTSPRAADALATHLRSLGICVLRNAVAPFTFRGVAAPVVGFDDALYGPGADISGVVASTPDGVPLVLAHQPDLVDRFPPHWAGLTLSGHTHAAQVRLSPFRNVDWPNLRQVSDMYSRYLRGFFHTRGNGLYVNRGLGTARWPIRLFARPELTILVLHCQ